MITKEDIEKANNLYFKKQLSINNIAKELNQSYGSILNIIDRNRFFKKDPKITRSNSLNEVNVIKKVVSNYFDITEDTLNLKSRISEIMLPRQLAHHLAYDLTRASNAFIGAEIGSLSHAAVLNSKNAIENYLSFDKKIIRIHQELIELCGIELRKL